MPKPSCKRMLYFIKDERKASKEYRKLRRMGLSRDEARHGRYWKKEYKKWCK